MSEPSASRPSQRLSSMTAIGVALPSLTFLVWMWLFDTLPLTTKTSETALMVVMGGGIVVSGVFVVIVFLPGAIARTILVVATAAVALMGGPQLAREWPLAREMAETGGRFSDFGEEDVPGMLWISELPNCDLGVYCVGGRIDVQSAVAETAEGARLPIHVDVTIPQFEDPRSLRIEPPMLGKIAADEERLVRRTIHLNVARVLAGRDLAGLARLELKCPKRRPIMGVPPGAAGPNEEIVGAYDLEPATAMVPVSVRIPSDACFELAVTPHPWWMALLLAWVPGALVLLASSFVRRGPETQG